MVSSTNHPCTFSIELDWLRASRGNAQESVSVCHCHASVSCIMHHSLLRVPRRGRNGINRKPQSTLIKYADAVMDHFIVTPNNTQRLLTVNVQTIKSRDHSLITESVSYSPSPHCADSGIITDISSLSILPAVRTSHRFESHHHRPPPRRHPPLSDRTVCACHRREI